MAVTYPAPIFSQPTSVTFAALTIASAASIIATRPFVSTMPSASPMLLLLLCPADSGDLSSACRGYKHLYFHLKVEATRHCLHSSHSLHSACSEAFTPDHSWLPPWTPVVRGFGPRGKPRYFNWRTASSIRAVSSRYVSRISVSASPSAPDTARRGTRRS